MKKAFCEPGNVSFNPPLALIERVVLPHSEEHALTVKRSADNGGDLIVSEIASLTADFADGKLHPGDLKPAVRGAAAHSVHRPRRACLPSVHSAESVHTVCGTGEGPLLS